MSNIHFDDSILRKEVNRMSRRDTKTHKKKKGMVVDNRGLRDLAVKRGNKEKSP